MSSDSFVYKLKHERFLLGFELGVDLSEKAHAELDTHTTDEPRHTRTHRHKKINTCLFAAEAHFQAAPWVQTVSQ